jgi:surfactin synthase thioesterase subunit
LSDALAPAAGGRCAFWGHSFGALTAFETARRLFHRNGALPARLFLSGARAPQLYKKERIHALNDKLFLERLRAFGGIPEEVLRDASLMQAFLPVIRHDFKLFEEHRFLAGDPLPVSISVFGGAGDSEVPVPDVLAWAVHTNRSFRSRFMDGGHFFPFTEIKQMTVFLREDMEAC